MSPEERIATRPKVVRIINALLQEVAAGDSPALHILDAFRWLHDMEPRIDDTTITAEQRDELLAALDWALPDILKLFSPALRTQAVNGIDGFIALVNFWAQAKEQRVETPQHLYDNANDSVCILRNNLENVSMVVETADGTASAYERLLVNVAKNFEMAIRIARRLDATESAPKLH